MACRRDGSDKLLKELVEKGINVILPPRAELKAGDLIIADENGAARSASWNVALGVEPPLNGNAEPTFTSVSFMVSDALQASAGASLIGKALAALGIGQGSLAAGFKKAGATSLNIELTAPAVSRLANLDEVLETLRAARAMPRPGYQDRRLFIVEKAWRARGLSLELQNSAGQHVDGSAELTEELKAKLKVELMSRGDGRITFVAEKALIFGVTLRELIIGLRGVEDSAADEHFIFRGGEGASNAITLSDDLFLEVDDA